eukprot:tig00000405_g466.t1
MAAFCALDALADRREAGAEGTEGPEGAEAGEAGEAEAEAHETPHDILKALGSLSAEFYLVAAATTVIYSCLFPFQAFTPDFLQNKWGYSQEGAARTTSLMSTVSMVALPLVGLAVDRFATHIPHIVFGAAALLVPCFLGLALTSLPPGPLLAAIGAGFCVAPAALWPSLAVVAPPRLYGTAYGLTASFTNVGLTGPPRPAPPRLRSEPVPAGLATGF